MEFKDAVKYLRSELGYTQIELANALRINPVTVGRWEKGKTLPTRSITAVLMDFARSKSASAPCLRILEEAVSSAARAKLNLPIDEVFPMEHASLRQLIDSSLVPIYIADIETDELLYLNRKAQDMLACGTEELPGRKCYQCFMHGDAPCSFCNKEALSEDNAAPYIVQRPFDGAAFKVYARLIRWNGRKAQVRYITPVDSKDALKPIVENMNGGVSVVSFNDHGEIRLAYANDRYYSLFGYTKDQFLSELKGPHDTLCPEDAEYVSNAIDNVKTTGQPATFRYRITKRDGSNAYISCSSSLSAVPGLGDKVLISVLTDVTSSAEAERQSIVFGQRLNAIMGNINNGVAASITQDDGSVDYVFVTDRYYEMLGYTRQQYHEEVSDPFALIFDHDRDTVRNSIQSLQNIGDSIELDYRAVQRDGGMIWFHADISMMSFADVADRPVMLCVFTDITAIVEATQRLNRQRDEMNELLNTTPSGIAVVELDPRDVAGTLHTTYYNDRFFSFSGYTRDEYDALLRRNEMSFVFTEDVPVLLKDTKSICEGEVGNFQSSTVRCHTKDGGYRWLLLTGQLAEKRGGICVVMVSMIDITARKEAEDRRRISEEMLRIAAETDKRALILYNVKANACRVESRSLYAAAFGEVIENVPHSLYQRGLVSPDSIAECDRMFERIRSGKEKSSFSLQLCTGRSEYQWFECNTTTIFDADGRPDQAVLVFHNITEQRVKEAVYKKWQQSIESRPPQTYTLFRCNLSKDTILDERDGELLKIQFTPDVVTFNQRTKQYVDEFVCPEDRDAYSSLLDSHILLAMFYRGERASTLEYREITGSGDTVWRRLTVELVEYLNSTDVQAFILYEDIDDQKKAEAAAKELSEIDPLTGALNRAAFAEKVDSILSTAPSVQGALLMLDMDGFKQLNDTFGHAAGDQALQDVVSVLRSFSHEGDLVCRLGGDEFLVWLRDIPYDAVIARIAEQMCQHIHKAYSQEVLVSASAGIAVYSRDGHDFDELYHNADKALYRVKQAEKGTYAFFSTSAQEPTQEITDALSRVRRSPQSAMGAKHRILIVEDNESSRILLKGIFRDQYLVETAKNGNEAMIRLRHFGASISVVLLDLFMPGMDGFAVLKKMQSNVDMRTIPVIVVSGNEERTTLLKAVELGAADYVTKPVDADLIRLRVQSAISKSENERLRAQNSYLQLQRDEEVKFRTVLDSTGTVVIEYDWRNHVFIYDSGISKHIAGNFDHRGLWQVFLADMVAESADVKALQDKLIGLANDRDSTQASKLVKLKSPNGEKHWFRMNIYKSVDEFGLAEKMIITFNDVHEEVLSNDKLLYQATRDELTGLYNRTGFLDKAAQLIAGKEPGYYVMSCVDIERFKVINDQYGAPKGDEVLRKFALVLERLHHNANGICCRVSADNFAVLYPAYLLDSPELERSHYAIEHLDDSIPSIQFAAGRCLVDDKALDVSSIYDRAAIAKNTVKGRYDVHIATFDESMRMAILRQQEITGQMNYALESGQFEVWLQPQFNHATGMLSGAEALVRWRHPTEGIISPSEFIPVFERNGFVYEVDKYVWEQTCILLRKWLDQGLSPVPISVNISRYDVFRENLVSVIQKLVRKYDLPLDLLRLEITESAFSESSEQIIKVVQTLVEAGFTVEIDDFGSGYSSLNTLKDVPAQILKMDMRFLENDKNAQHGGSIIESVIRMAKWLGMSVIAEGVETVEQADYLKSIGCENIQGYLYSQPARAEEYERLFAEGRTESWLGKLKSVESWNNNAFWNPTSMETLIFNSYVGGACIFEYKDGTAELLRYNDGYAKIFSSFSQLNYSDSHKNILSILDDVSAESLRKCIAAAIGTKKEAVCEIKLTSRVDQAVMFLRATMRQIAEAGERRLFYCVVTDMTEQRIAEQEQIRSSAQLQVIMDNMGGGVAASVVRDGKIHYLFANDRYYQLLGYQKDAYNAQFSGEFNVIHPEDRERTNALIRQAAKDCRPYSVNFRIIRPDGAVRWISCSINIITLPDVDEPVHLAAVSDTTELHEAQRRESVASKQMSAIMEHIHCGVTATVFRDKAHLELLFANDGFYELHGYTKAQWEAEVPDLLGPILPEDREHTMKAIERIVETRGSETYEYRSRRRDGAIMQTQTTNTVISLDGVGDSVLLAVITDVTELRTSQQKQNEISDKLKAVLNSAENGVTAAEMHGDAPELMFANDRYLEIHGISREAYERGEMPDPVSLVHADDRDTMRKTIVSTAAVGAKAELEYRVQRPDGELRWIKAVLNTVKITGLDAPVQVTVFVDVTQQKNYIAQLQYLNSTAHDILMQPDGEAAILETLQTLLRYHQADRGYVVELDHERMLSYNTYEVCADGVESQKNNLQALPFSQKDIWYESLTHDKHFYLDDAAAPEDGQSSERALLCAQGIRSVILAPLYNNGVFTGFAGIDNPRVHLRESERLSAMSDYISILLNRRDVARKRERDSRTIRELMNGTPGGFVRMRILDDGLVVPEYFNEGFQKLTGMSHDELMKAYGSDAMLGVHPEDHARVNAYRKRLLQEGSAQSIRFRIINGQGSYTWVNFSANIVKDDLGDSYINIYYTDATEQATEEEKQKNLLNNLTCGAALYEYDGARISVIHINDSYWKLVGREPADYSQESVESAICQEDKPLLMQELAACIRQRRNFSADLRILNGQGSYTPFHITASVVQRANGSYLFYTTYTPISTEAMSIQEMLPIAISTMMSASDNISYVKGKDLRYLSCSQAVADILGLESPRDLIGKTAGDVFEKKYADQFDADDARILTTGKSMVGMVERIPTANGGGKLVTTSKYPIMDASGNVIGVYSLSIDITSRKEQETQLELLTKSIPGGLAAYSLTPAGIQALCFNDGYYSWSGYTRQEYVALTDQEPLALLVEEDRDILRSMALELYGRRADGATGECTYRCRTKAGGLRWMKLSAMLAQAGEDRFVMNAVQLDVTQQMRSEQQRKDMLDNLPCGAAQYTFDGTVLSIVHLNKRCEKITGRSLHGSGAALPPMEYVHPEDRIVVMNEIKTAIAQNRSGECVIRVRHGKSGYRAFHVDAAIKPLGGGKYTLYATFSRISGQEFSFREALPFMFSTIMESSTDVAFAKGRDLRYLCCSRSLAELVGLKDAAEVVGKTDWELFPEEIAAQFRRDDEELMTTGEPRIDKVEAIPSPDGVLHFTKTSKHLLKNEAGEVIGIYGVGRDITEDKEAYAQLKLLAASIPGGIATFVAKSMDEIHLSYYNDGFRYLSGHSPEAFERYVAQPLALIFDDDREIVIPQLKALLNEEKPADCVFRIHTEDGGSKWVSFKAAVADRYQDSLVVNCVVIDITEQQLEKERLAQREEEYRLATEHSKRAICRYNIADRTLTITEDAAKRLSLPEVIPDVPYGRVKLGLLSPDTVDAYLAFYEAILRGQKESKAVFQKRFVTGWRWVSAHATTIYGADGQALSAIVSFVDVTEQQEKEAVYRKWKQGLKERREETYTLYQINLSKNSDSGTKEGTLLDYLPIQGDGKSFNQRVYDFAQRYVYAGDKKQYLAFMDADALLAGFYRGRRTASLDFRIQRSDDTPRWLRLTAELVEYPNSTDVEAYILFEDINDAKTAELIARAEAENDPLTGLLNRTTFTRRMEQLLAANDGTTLTALFMLDMDGFKLINDSFGHAAGDKVLIDAASAIRATLRENDLVCRLGGDEFLICLSGMPDKKSIRARAKQLCKLTHKAFNLDVRMSVSLGIAVCPDDGVTFDALYRKSDKALYYVKEHGKDNCAFYSENMHQGLGEHEQHAEHPPIAAPVGNYKRLMLIVEDERTNQLILQNIFTNDFEIETVDNGMDALVFLRRYASSVSVVLLDLMLPEMDGFAVLDKIREAPELQAVPVIVVSGMDDRETNLQAIGNGAADFVTKPVDAELLRIRVASAISKTENDRLRLQNQALKVHRYESERIRSILEADGTSITEYDPISDAFQYEPSMMHYLAGCFDERPLWDILVQDNDLAAGDALLLQAMVKCDPKAPVKANFALKTPLGETHMFRIKALPAAESWNEGKHVLLVFTDMTVFEP